MEMTQEKAIKRLKTLKSRCERLVVSSDRGPEEWRKDAEAVDFALTALRPVSRERVEKVLRGEWGRYCFSDDSHGYQCKNCGVQLDDPVYYRSFCPKCGKAMTDEAVEMVMERLEDVFQ